MRKTVVICLNPFISHFIPTLLLAQRLRHKGITVIYIGFMQMESLVREHGFEFCAITSYENGVINELQKKKAYKRLAEVYLSLHKEIQEWYEKLQADIVLIGISRYLIYLPPAFAVNANVMLYSLCAGEPGFSFSHQPITSDYVPINSNSLCSKLVYLLMWFRRYLRKGIGIDLLCSRRYYPWTNIFSICKERAVQWKFGVDGIFPDLPMIVFGTKHLEFGEYTNSTYTGLCDDDEYSINDVNSYIDFSDRDKPLVYCCLGTMSTRYRNRNDFLQAVIDLFKVNPQWNLLLSMGNSQEDIPFSELTSNIRVFKYVPQHCILPYVNLMLTHGGHGTVKECVYFGIPMAVFPCSYDQHGNAARVQYHKIGIKSSLLKKTVVQRLFGCGKRTIRPVDIEPLIKTVLEQEQYKKSVIGLRDKIIDNNELNKAVQVIMEFTRNN